MKNIRSTLVNKFSYLIQEKLEKVRRDIRDKSIINEDVDIILMLKKTVNSFQELPVWPFDTETISKFVMTYLPPVVSLIFSIFKDRIIALFHF